MIWMFKSVYDWNSSTTWLLRYIKHFYVTILQGEIPRFIDKYFLKWKG